MRTSFKTWQWAIVGACALLTAVSARAQTPPATAPLSPILPDRISDSAERAVERGGEEIETLKPAQKQDESLDTDAAADELQQSGGGSSILSKLPSAENLARLAEKIKAEPNNLDHYFAYAQMASSLGEYQKAAQTYEAMLQLVPNLDRIRLDLGSVYMRLGQLEDAQREMQTVLSRQPPDQVRANIESILAKIDGELREHLISGSVSVGLNYDSNGNSAPSGDRIVIFDTPINLGADQRVQHDLQLFTAAGLNHTYKPNWAKGDSINSSWRSSANIYQAKQSSLESLNLKVFSFTTGPEFIAKESGIRLSPAISHSHIVLATQTYLRTTALENTIDIPISEQFTLSGGIKHEWREFQNSDSVTTYEDRTGSATQYQIGGRYIITPNDFVSLALTSRRERTRRDYHDNEQLGATAGYTRVLPEGFFASATIGYKNTVYDDNDGLISAKTRHDTERSAGLTIGKKLNDTLTATVGYQLRDVDSNIINYDYDNHRFAATISARF